MKSITKGLYDKRGSAKHTYYWNLSCWCATLLKKYLVAVLELGYDKELDVSGRILRLQDEQGNAGGPRRSFFVRSQFRSFSKRFWGVWQNTDRPQPWSCSRILGRLRAPYGFLNDKKNHVGVHGSTFANYCCRCKPILEPTSGKEEKSTLLTGLAGSSHSPSFYAKTNSYHQHSSNGEEQKCHRQRSVDGEAFNFPSQAHIEQVSDHAYYTGMIVAKTILLQICAKLPQTLVVAHTLDPNWAAAQIQPFWCNVLT